MTCSQPKANHHSTFFLRNTFKIVERRYVSKRINKQMERETEYRLPSTSRYCSKRLLISGFEKSHFGHLVALAQLADDLQTIDDFAEYGVIHIEE